MTEHLGPGLRRLRAPNPSPLTGTGTNTYLLGAQDLAVIDPGPDLDTHLQAILAASRGRRIVAIVVTHAHRDHSALAPRLAAATGAEVLAFGSARDGMSPRMQAIAGLVATSGEGLDTAFTPDRQLGEGDRLSGADWELHALHTPGHLGGHICLAMDDLLFTGDHVMGWATSIVSPPEGDMGAYMASLRRLQDGSWRRFLPGHGDPVEEPAARLDTLIAHRLAREAQVLAALERGAATPDALTALIYHDTPQDLWPAARRNVLAHLLDLLSRNLVAADPVPGPGALFRRL
ncbi:MBL fold metallo-hydrolase [Tabrizicola caldifontis]|uniref:MBL fold metallo-hydrolase n=1 Tax=Tabrizicola caldifontis TaxID=2528036 RepID=UPI00108058E5|nr:MBL fold metallo-hydrolase [Rhodobacter sp. YIM 73028]